MGQAQWQRAPLRTVGHRELGWTRWEVFLDQPKAIDIHTAPVLDAEAALLGGEVLRRWQEPMRNGRLPVEALERLASSHGTGNDGDALHASPEAAHARAMPFVKLRGHREAASGFPSATGRHPRTSPQPHEPPPRNAKTSD